MAVELGWTDVDGDALALAIISEELGRAACPWPMAEVFVAATLFAGAEEISRGLREGTIRPTLVDAVTGVAEFVPGVTHGLIVRGDECALAPIEAASPIEGTWPALARVDLGARTSPTAGLGALPWAAAALGLGLAARAVGGPLAGASSACGTRSTGSSSASRSAPSRP